MTPAADRRAQLSAHPRPQRSRRLHQPARREGRAGGSRSADREGCGAAAAARRARRGEGQYRRRWACRPPPPARPSPICRRSDATAVARLRAAGAIVIGKTNLDQFATGLVGVRSPYGIPVNPIRADLIPGGSSSGSAVAVSAGLVPLALGTDTAGSRPRAGDAQQHRRPEAEPRADLRPPAWCRPAGRSIASRCSRSPSTTR